MPNAVIMGIADAVTDLLNGATLSQSFVAERVFIPTYKVDEQPGLKVFVVITSSSIDLNAATRGETPITHSIQVGIFNTIDRDEYGAISAIEIEDMIYFTQEVYDLIKANSNQADAALSRIDVPVPFDADRLEQHEVFLTVVALDYLAYSDRS